jgi:hypothetical protein
LQAVASICKREVNVRFGPKWTFSLSGISDLFLLDTGPFRPPLVPQWSIGAEVEYTREKLLGELEHARAVAEEAHNGSAMAMATMGKAKLLGLIIDRREVGDVGSFDNLTDEELVEEAKKRAKALGFDPKLN